MDSLSPQDGKSGKLFALLEVAGVFALALLAVVLVARSPFAQWARTLLLRPFVEYLALGLTPTLAIGLARRPLATYGITAANPREQLDLSLVCLLPYAVAKAWSFAVSRVQGLSSLTEPLLALGVAMVWARLVVVRRQRVSSALLWILLAGSQLSLGKATSALVFYPFVLAPAEELLFRGHIQSRLNQAFGRPWRVAGAEVGVGLFVSAGLFSFFHAVNLPALVAGRLDPAWAMALPTLAWGLAFGYLRERTDSLLPSTLCHGVPQGIAWAFLGR